MHFSAAKRSDKYAYQNNEIYTQMCIFLRDTTLRTRIHFNHNHNFSLEIEKNPTGSVEIFA